jgi:hypothetical protein
LKNSANSWTGYNDFLGADYQRLVIQATDAAPYYWTWATDKSSTNGSSYIEFWNGAAQILSIQFLTDGTVYFPGAPRMPGDNITNIPAGELTGTLPNGVFPATLPATSGVNLTNLNASNLASGTIPNARFPATLPAVSAANLTNIPAGNLTGSIADARLSANVPLKNAANNWTGKQGFTAGAAVTPAAAPSTDEVGYLGTPQNIQNAAYGIVMADIGKQIYHSDGTARVYTIPANAAIAIPIGSKIEIANGHGAADVTIAITTDTLRWLPSGGTGSRTLKADGSAIISKVTATEWQISGVNLT